MKVNYGFDGPDFMFPAAAVGVAALLVGLGLPMLSSATWLHYLGTTLAILSLLPLILVAMMVAYGLGGKHRTRDLLMSKIQWRGDEQVLDIGSGLGLLLNGAAKRLTTGKAIGIDIWRTADLTGGNNRENALKNAELEGVRDKITLLDMDAQQLAFEDAAFDVIFSLFCIHNIPSDEGQQKACHEIARVLRPNGVALIGEFMPIAHYAKWFTAAGLTVKRNQTYFSTAYSAMWIVEVTKA